MTDRLLFLVMGIFIVFWIIYYARRAEFQGLARGNLQKKGKLEKLIIPNRQKYSALLRKFAGEMAFIDGLKGKLEYPGQ